MASGAAEGLLGCVYEGCITAYDTEIERRPYHRNCGCALHKSGGTGTCSMGSPQNRKISYPCRRAWSEGCLAMAASKYTSPSSSPAHSNKAGSSPAYKSGSSPAYAEREPSGISGVFDTCLVKANVPNKNNFRRSCYRSMGQVSTRKKWKGFVQRVLETVRAGNEKEKKSVSWEI